MGRYYVESVVNFAGWVEADSRSDAMEKGYYYDNLVYESVESVDVVEEEEED
jgi:hypothetical protein